MTAFILADAGSPKGGGFLLVVAVVLAAAGAAAAATATKSRCFSAVASATFLYLTVVLELWRLLSPPEPGYSVDFTRDELLFENRLAAGLAWAWFLSGASLLRATWRAFRGDEKPSPPASQ